jgi:hypothetical protein
VAVFSLGQTEDPLDPNVIWRCLFRHPSAAVFSIYRHDRGAASIHIFTGKRQKSVYFKAKTFLCSLFFQTTLYYTSLNMV